jgi:hypothetical protein
MITAYNTCSPSLQVGSRTEMVDPTLLSGLIVCPVPRGLRAGRQNGQGTRYDEERRHIAYQMPHMLRLSHRLDGHHSPVYRARPDGEARVKNTPRVA